ELMPVATFPGERGWGYDGVLTSAPHRAYGGPQALARLVDAAHARGLAVILDVVYNHVGPGSELASFGPYFTDRFDTFWGDALDYSQRGVREWAIQNAELWVRDYRIDGLRLDATHAIFDESKPHIMVELAERVRAAHPGVLVIAEMAVGDRAARGVGTRRAVGRRAAPRAARAADRRARGLLQALRQGRRSRACVYRRHASRSLRAEPRPGRQPRARRPAAARDAPRRGGVRA